MEKDNKKRRVCPRGASTMCKTEFLLYKIWYYSILKWFYIIQIWLFPTLSLLFCSKWFFQKQKLSKKKMYFGKWWKDKLEYIYIYIYNQR